MLDWVTGVERAERVVCAYGVSAIANFAGLTGFLSAEHDLVIIGGGVAGYVAAIKAGQEGLKVRLQSASKRMVPEFLRWPLRYEQVRTC